MKKQLLLKTRGMNRDLSVASFNPEFSFENLNLRLSTNENNTMLSWVNEKGTAKITLVDADKNTVTLMGIPTGQAVINHQIVLFTHEEAGGDYPDHIYLLYPPNEDSNTCLVEELYKGNLELDSSRPLETLVSYETELVQKVYWVDGYNQPRVINIKGNIRDYHPEDGTDTQFDFAPELSLEEEVSVEKLLGAGGSFAPGVIQYAMTYFYKNGQETNIFYTTPLLYVSFRDRGASPEDRVDNAFKITIEHIDEKFDYLRIYSIQRTIINGTPFVKRVCDLALKDVDERKTTYIDTGYSGDSIDPTELLYKGSEVIKAHTIEQKDGTLFLGNLSIERKNIRNVLGSSYDIHEYNETSALHPFSRRSITPLYVSGEPYPYSSQLTSVQGSGNTVPCSTFKSGETYRCGVQFQHKSGKWSEPVFIDDVDIKDHPEVSGSSLLLPQFIGVVGSSTSSTLYNSGYRKARAVVVFPDMQDRNIVCQGVVNSVLKMSSRNYKQSSWFFRPINSGVKINSDGTVAPYFPQSALRYTSRSTQWNPENIRSVEVQGAYDANDIFSVEHNYVTLHSPDIEFDDQLQIADYSGSGYKVRGHVSFEKTLSDISIQTETPTISSNGSGFVHKSFTENGSCGIVSGLFYDDYIADDDINSNGDFGAYPDQKSSAKWLVYPWQRSGSLTNDITRPADKGVTTSVLKKKVISNLRYASTLLNLDINIGNNVIPQLFASDEISVVKLDGELYEGNIDTLIVPSFADGTYFAWNGLKYYPDLLPYNIHIDDDETPFDSVEWSKIYPSVANPDDPTTEVYHGIWKWCSNEWKCYLHDDGDIGDKYKDLAIRKESVRMKYKSTPHLVAYLNTQGVSGFASNHVFSYSGFGDDSLPIVEVTKPVVDDTRFGGKSDSALRENVWIPCGKPVRINDEGETVFYYEYGDTYFQRWDCLKTYSFTPEDPNQIVEIGSFMLETRVNIDGRYDRNRGQLDNLNMNPQNFNLLNPVYSQKDNFFSYRITENVSESPSDTQQYPNQLTWTLTKQSGADVDLWTSITLANTLELDGDKGAVTSLQRLNDQLLCFQDRSLSHILYNENVQIATTEGVPIEIANSGRVQGKRYLSDTVGCSNKHSIATTPSGIYFIDSSEKSIYLYNGQLINLSTQGGMNTWIKQQELQKAWNPVSCNNFVSYYDAKNQDVLFITEDTALAYSEKMGTFTSFYDYGKTPYFCDLDGIGLWVRPSGYTTELWLHHGGDYCNFFDTVEPYHTILVVNPEPQMDKLFTNLEFRAVVEGDGKIAGGGSGIGFSVFDYTFDFTFGRNGGVSREKFVPYLPIDYLETWDEYQHGKATLQNKNGHISFEHHRKDMTASLKRKFRIWRCDIPRDNMEVDSDTENKMGIFRYKKRPLDRMRNPWIYLKLRKEADTEGMKRVELYDMGVSYYV